MRTVLSPATVPPLTPEEARHGERVAARLREAIAGAGGPIPFSRFMEIALYEPGLGYYATGRVRFGHGGDFVTAPELSPLFARCLATQVAGILALTGGGDVVEYGAGSGRLAAELLDALDARGTAPARYRFVEPSAALRQAQRERLAGRERAGPAIEWLDRPPRDAWRGVALANEVLDALPVDRFRVTAAGCESLAVQVAGGGFDWQPAPADAALAAAVAALVGRLPAGLPAGYVSELRLTLASWFAEASAALEHGVFLVTDYGLPRAQYYHASRDGGTLCGYRRHRRVDDVLARPGLQDLTAWVDFSALADAARAGGFAVAGFSTQAHFLAALGVDRELAALREPAGPRGRLALTEAARTLLLPGEMGERFKAMALARGVDAPLAGFSFRDLTESL